MNQNIKKNRKIVLITGAARRLGKAIALKLHSSGMDIIIHCNKSEKDAKKLVSDMNLLREDSAKYISLNLRDFKKYENFLPSLGDRWENIDVLINNASTFYPNQIDKSSLENWNDLQDVYEQRWKQEKERYQQQLKANFFALTERFASGQQEIFVLTTPERREKLYTDAFLELFESLSEYFGEHVQPKSL